MFQTCPEIHCDRTDLDLYLGIYNAVRKKYRYRYQHMIALISTFFWILNIVFDRQYFQITLIADHLCQPVNIRRKGTDQAYSCNIIDIFYHVLNRYLVTIPA